MLPPPPSPLLLPPREAMVLVHKGDVCQPSFKAEGLDGFGRFPDMYSLLSVDTDHADKVSYCRHKETRRWFADVRSQS